VTSQPQPAPVGDRPVGQFLRPLRDLAALALVVVPAVLLFVAVIRLIPSGDGLNFSSRTQDSFYSFVNLATIFFPLGGVLLALGIKPQHPKAKLITLIAAAEYAVAGFFAVIFGILVGLIQIVDFSVRTAFEELLVRAAWLVVFALAAYATYLLWRNLYYVPRPKAQPGVYGQPQYGAPGAYPGQPGYGPPGGYPPPGPGQAGFGQPGQPGQPGFGQPPAGWGPPGPQPGYGQPPHPGAPAAPAWGQPPVSGQPAGGSPVGAPVSGPGTPPGPYPPAPAPGTPGSPGSPAGAPGGPASGTYGTPPAPGAFGTPPAPGTYGAPSPAGPYSEPTQVVPRPDATPDPDRTTTLPDERPGFGPADQDQPRP
jgi:hypothetical protein